jgi:diaminopimelate epimerase
MNIRFSKYHGTGNDFIILDNRKGDYDLLSNAQIASMCNRHFGIGADGLMLLGAPEGVDFSMRYYNADGNESSMCGNGGRCLVAYAQSLNIIEKEAHFLAIDGMHHAIIDSTDFIELKMNDVTAIEKVGDAFVLNTGSPHYVIAKSNAKSIDVRTEGKLVRYSEPFAKNGINVNFIEVLADKTLFVATYERGVEDETWSCGTGVVASALTQVQHIIGGNYVRVSTKGGTLLVKCVNQNKQHFTDIWLCGPAKFVFEGQINL